MKSAPKERDSKKKPAQPKENDDRARRNVKVKEGATEEKCVAGPVVTRAQAKKSDKVHPLKVKEAMSSVDKSTIENLQKKDSTLKKCFDRIGKPIIRQNYVGEFNKKNGLLYRKHQETKTGRSFNQLVVPKELRRQVMSVNHESAFSLHLGQRRQKSEYSRTSFGQDYARTSSGSVAPVMYAREPSRGVVSRRYH